MISINSVHVRQLARVLIYDTANTNYNYMNVIHIVVIITTV